MKFNVVLDKIQNDPILEKKKNEKDVLDDVFDYKLYNNIAIYLMKPGVKGNFKLIAPVIHNGIAPSWAIRIYYVNNNYTLHFASHPNIIIDFNLREYVESVFGHEVLGHNHVVMITASSKELIERAINELIGAFKDNKLPLIECEAVDDKYLTETSIKKYKIPKGYSIDVFDDTTYKKYLLFIKSLLNAAMDENDKNEVIRISKRFISSKLLTTRELKQINSYIEKYIDSHIKIKIALQVLAKNN